MKLFSRKAIVAGATALAVTFAGTSVAVAEDETPRVSTPSESSKTPTPVEKDDTKEDNNNDDKKKEGGSSSDPKEITAWISVFTAVIGALGTLFTFANKHFNFMS